MNNKMIKGSVAGATGIVLLMGGFGTYALWSDSATLDRDTITSGALDIGTPGTASWTDVSADGPAGGTTWNPASDKMVPGDTVKLTQPLALDVSGKNLKVKFTVSGINPTADGWENLGVTMKYDGIDLEPVTSGGPAYQYVYNAPAGTALNGTKNLEVTFDFPASVGSTGHGGNDLSEPTLTDQNETLDLNAIGVAVEQVRP